MQWRSKGESQNLTYMAQCTVDGNTVQFSFEREVHLERVTITSPGEGKGPSAYSATLSQQQRRPNGSMTTHMVTSLFPPHTHVYATPHSIFIW